MFGSKLQIPNSNRLYSSTVGESRRPSSSVYEKRNTLMTPSTPSNNYLTPNYTDSLRNNRKEDYNLLRVTVSTADKSEGIVSKTRDQLSKSQAYGMEAHSRSARKYDTPSTDRDKYDFGARDALFIDKVDNRKQGLGEDYEKLLEKINKKDKIIKELQQLCETKVSDNIRGYAYQKDKAEIYSPVRAKRYAGNKPVGMTANEGIRSTLDAPSSFNINLTKTSPYEKVDLDKKGPEQFSPTRKGSEYIPSRRNPEDPLGKQGYQLSKLSSSPQETKKKSDSNTKQQFKISIHSSSNLEMRDTSETMGNGSGLFVSKNVTQISKYTIQPFQSLRARKSKEEEVREEKINIEVKKVPEFPSVKASSNTFGDKALTITDFELKKNLGEGKFGIVYQAFHKQTNSLFALKKISKAMIKSHMMEDQFLLQVKIQSYCNHQNILKIYGCFDDAENIYLVLEYMEQGTLFSLLKQKKTLNQEEAAISLKHICKAVVYLHQNGIAHRDIKPENIVMSNGVGKLCDFGWAAVCTDRRKTYCGTFDYVAPEILQGAEYDATVDLWCLGVMAFQLLVGKAPFYHISRKQTMKKIMNVEKIEFPPTLSHDAVSFIDGLIKKNPEERMFGSDILKHPFLAKVDESGK